MSFAGDFGPVSPGEIKSFSIDFSSQMTSDDYLTAATATLAAYYGTDANAASLPIGAPARSQTVVSQMIGATGSSGFQPGVIYRWTVTATTADGLTLVSYGHIACNAVS